MEFCLPGTSLQSVDSDTKHTDEDHTAELHTEHSTIAVVNVDSE